MKIRKQQIKEKRNQPTKATPTKNGSKPNTVLQARGKKLLIKKRSAPRTPKQYFALSEESQEQWNRIAHVVQKVRTERVSLTQAAKEFSIDRKKVIKLGGSALRKQKNGRYTAKSYDRLLRVLVIPSTDGLKEVAVRDSRSASKIAEYSNAVQRFLQTGDQSDLRKFKRVRINDVAGNRIKLLTDPQELIRLGSAGVLSFESLYARAA